MTRVEVWTANFGRGADSAKYKRNLERLLAAADSDRAVLCLQEIDEADEPDEHGILRSLTAVGYARAGWKTSVPILLSRSHFKLRASRVKVASRGLAGVTPHRPVVLALTWVLRLHGSRVGQVDPEAPEMAFVNFHIPLKRPSTMGRRLQVRAVAAAKIAFNLARGRVVVACCDSNTRGVWKPLVRGEKVVLDAGIDMILVYVPTGWRVNVVKRKRVDLRIDGHDAHGAVLDFLPA